MSRVLRRLESSSWTNEQIVEEKGANYAHAKRTPMTHLRASILNKFILYSLRLTPVSQNVFERVPQIEMLGDEERKEGVSKGGERVASPVSGCEDVALSASSAGEPLEPEPVQSQARIDTFSTLFHQVTSESNYRVEVK